MKSKSNNILTMQGSIRYVAQYLQDHLPESEANAESDEDVEETDEVPWSYLSFQTEINSLNLKFIFQILIEYQHK